MNHVSFIPASIDSNQASGQSGCVQVFLNDSNSNLTVSRVKSANVAMPSTGNYASNTSNKYTFGNNFNLANMADKVKNLTDLDKLNKEVASHTNKNEQGEFDYEKDSQGKFILDSKKKKITIKHNRLVGHTVCTLKNGEFTIFYRPVDSQPAVKVRFNKEDLCNAMLDLQQRSAEQIADAVNKYLVKSSGQAKSSQSDF